MTLAAMDLREDRHRLVDFTLGTVCRHYDVRPRGAVHDAQTDVRMVVELWDKLEAGEG